MVCSKSRFPVASSSVFNEIQVPPRFINRSSIAHVKDQRRTTVVRQVIKWPGHIAPKQMALWNFLSTRTSEAAQGRFCRKAATAPHGRRKQGGGHGTQNRLLYYVQCTLNPCTGPTAHCNCSAGSCEIL